MSRSIRRAALSLREQVNGNRQSELSCPCSSSGYGSAVGEHDMLGTIYKPNDLLQVFL